MKKGLRILCCVLALCMLLPTAWAETQEEFEAACDARTTAPCTVHNGSKDGAVNAMLPAGTLVRVMETDGSWSKLQFFYRGLKMSGWAEAALETVQPAATTAPTTPPVPEAPAEEPQAPEAPAEAAPASAPDAIVTLGTVQSLVRYGAEERMAATAELNLGGDMPADKQIAVVYAPKTGKATLRETASKNGKEIRQCAAGAVVAVLSQDGDFCRISIQGEEGYILVSCLEYHSSTAETLGTAVLSLKGATDGKSKINVRNAADRDSAKVAEWKTGMEVTVFSHKGSWYEIEAEGIHGWVQEAYVTMNAEN